MGKSLIYLICLHVLWFYMECSGLFQNIQFIGKLVGYNSDLDINTMDVTTEQSLIACGVACNEKNCTSFLYETTYYRCTLYSVYMIGDGAILDNYYVTNGAEETINVIGTCLTFTYNSSFTNVALGKPVTMSSIYSNPNYDDNDPSMLVNDDRDGFYPCAHTDEEVNPYMNVDLGQNFNVHSLYVLNRQEDCCADRLFNVKIELGDTTETMREYVYRDGLFGSECTFVLDHITVARYVRVSVVGETYLSVCELGVYSLS